MHSASAEKSSLEVLTNTLGVPLGTAKQMVFKKRALLTMQPDELLDRVRQVGATCWAVEGLLSCTLIKRQGC